MTQQLVEWADSETAFQADWTPGRFGAVDRQPFEGRRISQNPRTWGGKAIISGTRIPVFMIHDLHQSGETVEEILGRFPRLSAADVYMALAYSHANAGVVNLDRENYREEVDRILG